MVGVVVGGTGSGTNVYSVDSIAEYNTDTIYSTYLAEHSPRIPLKFINREEHPDGGKGSQSLVNPNALHDNFTAGAHGRWLLNMCKCNYIPAESANAFSRVDYGCVV